MKRTSPTFLLIALLGAFSLTTVGTPRISSSTSRMDSSFLARTSNLFVQEAGEITEANWQQHPKIREIRAIVQAVNNGMSRKSLRVRKRAFDYCEPYEDTRRTIAADSRGRVRFYANEGGSDDSALKWECYYDETGRLRFVFITGGAINGSKLEHRIYFDETGKRLWEDHVYKKGPGYTFPEVWPDDQLQLDNPAAKFSSKAPCKEIRKKGKR